MADRVKYFVLGLLFLVVAGVIAYDNWNSKGTPDKIPDRVADEGDVVDVEVDKSRKKRGGGLAVRPPDDKEVPFKREPTPEPRPEPKPEPTPEPRPEPKPEPKVQDRVHVVRSGESLGEIAVKYYGTRRGVQWIVERNGLRDADRIFEKQKLIIPARADIKRSVATNKTKPAVKKTPAKVPARYVVKSSDGDLYAICRRFYGAKGEGARVARIMELNQLWSAKVKPGAVLILPPK